MPDIDHIAKSFMASPQGVKIIKGLDKFNTSMSSENGRQLLTMLADTSSEVLHNAAKTAAAATHDQGRALISALLSTKEGAAIVAKVIEILGV